MKIIMNQISNILIFTCKECKRTYTIDYKKVRSIPLWQYESCSRTCAKKKSKNKLITLKN